MLHLTECVPVPHPLPRPMPSLSELLERFDGQLIPHCPGRYVLRGVETTDGPQAIVGSCAAVTEHHVAKARETVVVTWLNGWGLISYARIDGTWLHTANTPDGFRRKLADLGIPVRDQAILDSAS